MGNCPTPLRRAIRDRDEQRVRQVLDEAGDKADAAWMINADHSPDCIMDSCSSVQGNALYYAVKYRHEESIVVLLLDHGGDLHATGEYGETCLHGAARLNYSNTCKLLIQRGADPYATDDNGRYPIHSAVQSMFNTEKTVTFLLTEAGKKDDVKLRDFNNRTPLHEAAYHGNAEVVKLLIEHGADVNALSNANNTPLHMTTTDSPVWAILVSKGADTSVKNNHGELPGNAV